MKLARRLAFLVALTVAGPSIASETTIYTYDAKGRLLTVTHTGSVNNGQVTSYSHDSADNRKRVTTTGASH